MILNPILNTDSYKLSHFLQYPPEAERISAYIETRGFSEKPEIVFFGLQMFLKSYLSRAIGQADVDAAETLALRHGVPFDRDGWQYIVDRHDGLLPLRIEALPEGMTVRRGIPLVQVTNTDPRLPWLASHVETAMLRGVWYPSSVASAALKLRQAIRPFLEKTSDEPEALLATRIFDFGARGTTSLEQSGLGGAAHLLYFSQTDTLSGVLFAQEYYGADMAGRSIPASEHTTMTAWGPAREAEAYANMIEQFGDGTAYSVVSDSYDIHNAVSEIWGKQLNEKVRNAKATLIVRPDSGDPIDTPLQVIGQLAYAFGTRQNGKGYKILDANVRVLQGDGVSLQDIVMILGRLEASGFSAENISFGMGSHLSQRLNRDTYSFTMKANAMQDSSGIWRDIAKRPVTMQEKASKSGRQAVVADGGIVSAIRLNELGGRENLLVPVWENGMLLKDWSFDEVRARAALV